MTQPALFDAANTVDQPCPVPGCSAIKLAGQTPPIITCQHDRQTEGPRGKRPRYCLNRTDPATTDWGGF